MINTYKDVSRQTLFLGMKPLDSVIVGFVMIVSIRFAGIIFGQLTGLLFSAVLTGTLFYIARKYSSRPYTYTDLQAFLSTEPRFSVEKEYADNSHKRPVVSE